MYPLLVQGIYSNPNAGQLSINPGLGSNFAWNNTIQIGRGNLIGIDPIATGVSLANALNEAGTFSYNVGGQTIIDNAQIGSYIVENKPRTNEILSLNQPGGQSLQLSGRNTATVGAGIVVHHYFENKFATPSIIAARYSSSLKTRIKDYVFKFASNTKNNASSIFNVPVGLGNIVGIEFTCFTDNASLVTLSQTVFSCNVSGIEIVQNACLSAFCTLSGRPSQIFPILIRPGETFQLFADSSNTAAGATCGVVARLYFDDDLTGKKVY